MRYVVFALDELLQGLSQVRLTDGSGTQDSDPSQDDETGPTPRSGEVGEHFIYDTILKPNTCSVFIAQEPCTCIIKETNVSLL
jgi:hypothetical protein